MPSHGMRCRMARTIRNWSTRVKRILIETNAVLHCISRVPRAVSSSWPSYKKFLPKVCWKNVNGSSVESHFVFDPFLVATITIQFYFLSFRSSRTFVLCEAMRTAATEFIFTPHWIDDGGVCVNENEQRTHKSQTKRNCVCECRKTVLWVWLHRYWFRFRY